jgi:hypothetical protein
MPATVWMQARAVTQATTVTPATSAIKDDSNIMTAHNSRNASNSRNESHNSTANTVWMPPKAGLLAKTVKPDTAWREANNSSSITSLQETFLILLSKKDAHNKFAGNFPNFTI